MDKPLYPSIARRAGGPTTFIQVSRPMEAKKETKRQITSVHVTYCTSE